MKSLFVCICVALSTACTAGFRAAPSVSSSSQTIRVHSVCEANSQQTCQVSNGTGSQICNSQGSAWGACGNLTSCNTGFYFQNGSCRPPSWVENPPLTVKQTAPTVKSADLDFIGVVGVLQGSHNNSWSQFNLRATNGYNLDVLDLVDTNDSNYRYVGVSHSYSHPVPGGCVNLTWSNDLRTWHFSHAIECGDSSQASIRRLSDGSYLVAYEANPQSLGASVKVRHYASLGALLANTPADETVAPRLPGVLNAGTPSFREIFYQGGGLNSMQFELPYHHCQVSNCIDEQGFMTWNWPGISGPWNINNNWMSLVVPLNPRLRALGINGNIGGRESFDIGGQRYFLVEGQATIKDWSTWRLYLVQESSQKVVKLQIQTPAGSQAMGNPKISFVTLPNGQAALVGTTFIFSEQPSGTAPDAGTHLFVYPFN